MSKKPVSVVVPTYNETENIRPLCERLFKAFKKASLEGDLLYVDDESPGSDETASIVKALQKEGYAVNIHQRKRSEGRGLSSAVLIGFEKAKNDIVIVMDADLQHEPEAVPDMAGPLLDGTAVFVMGSRNVDGGGIGFEWAAYRRVMSLGATLLARGLTNATDPMSGFMGCSKETYRKGKSTISPIGFKIALEMIVRCDVKEVCDVPITFCQREAGESKLDGKVMKNYLEQLWTLYCYKYGMGTVLGVFLALVLVGLFVLQMLLKVAGVI